MEKIIEKDICEVSSQGFINYALETIKARAIPDVRDGLKPVTRRVIYAMHELNLYPDKPYKKSARIVGDAMGKYHPHGDSSIYGALVTSAQVFREQLPLIDGYGNFGSVDDSAAAMRYCVTGDTLINTNKGLIPIKDIVQNSQLNSDNPIDIMIQSRDNKINKANMFFNSGEHKIIEIVLNNGMSIKGSYNHPILTIQEIENDLPQLVWKTLDKINSNDKIVVNRKYNVFSNEDKITKEEARILGLLISEGSIYEKHNRIDFINKDKELVNEMKSYMENIFNVHICDSQRKDECIELQIHSKECFNEWITKYDLKKYSENKIVPRVILQSSLDIQKEFLKYLYEGDGSVSIVKDKRKNSKSLIVSYSSNSIKLLKTIQIMLLQFGIYSSITKSKKKNYKLNFSGKNNIILFYKKIGFVSKRKMSILKDCYKYAIKSSKFETYGYDSIPYLTNYINNKYSSRVQKLGYKNKKRFNKNRNRLNKLLEEKDYNFINDIHNKEYLFLNIKEINYLDKEIVYSIRVDSDCHSFVGNGFVNHNTESRLTTYGAYLLDGLNENAVDFVSNYDDTEKEPEVLPAFTPNILVNGEFGIAVGYQPNIPPHNYNELIDGIIYEMDNPKATTKDLMKFVKGPDFPEGAIIDPIELELCYETGKGTIPMRAKLLVETLPLGKSQIVITEVPYLTSKEKLVSDIAKALSPEEFCFDSVTDETNKNGTRIIISFDKGANIEKAIDVLCKKTQVQSNFSYNFVAIYNNEPITFSLKQYFDVFIETKLTVLKRIFINRLEKEKKNNERLKAIHIGALKIDEVIKIIKTSKTAKIAKERLMETLGVSEYGAQVIFEMRLSSLINTEVINVEKDIKASDKRIKELEKSINNEKQLKLKLKEKLLETKELFGQPRKTKIQKFEKMKTVVQEEEFVLQAIGKKYKKMSSTYKGDKGICLKTKSSSVINTFLNNGDFARYLGNQIKSEENYDIIGLFDDSNTKNIFFVTNEGQVKQTSFDDYKQIALDKYVISMKLNEKEKIIACFACDDDSEVYIETKNGYAIRFFTNEVRPTGRIAGGMRGINLEKGDVAIKAGLVKKGTIQASYKQQKRAGKGNKIK